MQAALEKEKKKKRVKSSGAECCCVLVVAVMAHKFIIISEVVIYLHARKKGLVKEDQVLFSLPWHNNIKRTIFAKQCLFITRYGSSQSKVALNRHILDKSSLSFSPVCKAWTPTRRRRCAYATIVRAGGWGSCARPR